MPRQKSIHDLDERELELYFKTLTAVANSDGEFDRKEKAFIEDQAELVGFDIKQYIEKPEENLDFLNNTTIFQSSGKIILRDCLLVCYADGIFNEFEKKAMMNIAGLLGVSDQDFTKIDEWRSGILERI